MKIGERLLITKKLGPIIIVGQLKKKGTPIISYLLHSSLGQTLNMSNKSNMVWLLKGRLITLLWMNKTLRIGIDHWTLEV